MNHRDLVMMFMRQRHLPNIGFNQGKYGHQPMSHGDSFVFVFGWDLVM